MQKPFKRIGSQKQGNTNLGSRKRGIKENQKADEFAKKGSSFNLIGAKPLSGINLKIEKVALFNWEKKWGDK